MCKINVINWNKCKEKKLHYSESKYNKVNDHTLKSLILEVGQCGMHNYSIENFSSLPNTFWNLYALLGMVGSSVKTLAFAGKNLMSFSQKKLADTCVL